MSTETRSPDEWGSAYEAMRPLHEVYATRLAGLLDDILRSNNIDVIQIEARAKSVESVVEKIKRKKLTHPEPLKDMTDLVGVRIIAYYIDDIDKIGNIISREFTVDSANSMNKRESMASDQFGYLSAHFVVANKATRRNLAEWKQFANIAAEIQVRTALQHAWAAVNHKLDYKQASEAPPQMQRGLFRLSALFELADEQFALLRDSRAAADAENRNAIELGQLSLPIDASSIEAYLLLSERAISTRKQVMDAGFSLATPDKLGSERHKRDISDLVKMLRDAGLTSLSNLHSQLGNETRIRQIVDALFATESETDPEWVEATGFEDLLTAVLLIDNPISTKLLNEIYRPEFAEMLDRVRATL